MSTPLGPELPPEVLRDLRGLSEAKDQAIPIVTTDEDGYPRLAMFCRSEIELVDSTRLFLALWPTSNTATNITREGKATFFWVASGGMYTIQIRCEESALLQLQDGTSLLAFDAFVVGARFDEVEYASIVTPLTFEVHNPDAVIPRWSDLGNRLAGLADGVRAGR